MRRSLSHFAVLSVAVLVVACSGCYHPHYRLGPPPPGYGCDSYGCDSYGYGTGGYGLFGGYGECIDDGQRLSWRDRRRMRRTDRRSGSGWNGQTINGMPVMAAYIVPMDGSGSWGGGFGCGCDPCGGCMSCGDGFPCSTCGPDGGMHWMPGGEPCMSCGEMNGCPIEGGYPVYDSGEPTPTPNGAAPGSDVPEGNWEGGPPVPPQSFLEPAASRPIERNWLPASY